MEWPTGSFDPVRRVYSSVDQLIANPENPTPLVRLNRLRGDRPSAETSELYLKLEWYNPFGSVKDRVARYLLNDLLESGRLDGKEIVEPTSGNTGIALVALANLLGVPATITVPSEVPEEKQVLLRWIGADLRPTPDDLCPVDHPRDGAIALARSLADSPEHAGRYVFPNQYENEENVRAHYETTGPEIWRQTEGRVRFFFAGYGTCGTLIGVGRYLKERDASVRIVAIEPPKGHRQPGLKNLTESKAPGILDRSVIDEVIGVEDGDAYRTARDLAQKEGLLVGPSTGAIVAGAVRHLAGKEGIAVALSPDNAFKYASFFSETLGLPRREAPSSRPEEQVVESSPLEPDRYDLTGLVCPASKVRATEILQARKLGQPLEFFLADRESLSSLVGELKSREIAFEYRREGGRHLVAIKP